ncbi:MAG: hypothetical protein K9N35_08315 [Candidatus Marinimicrobia bacterium]|nr:hypothetical protein [Candidatus Neomarinimicrobiota bacterium]
MKLIISMIFIAALLVSCGNKDEMAMKTEQTKPMHQAQMMDAGGEKLIYYTCPMESHKHVHSAEAGNCPECGMALVEGVVTSVDKMEYYGCPMEIHSHIRKDTPGRCEECKMELKPMRLKTSQG